MEMAVFHLVSSNDDDAAWQAVHYSVTESEFFLHSSPLNDSSLVAVPSSRSFCGGAERVLCCGISRMPVDVPLDICSICSLLARRLQIERTYCTGNKSPAFARESQSYFPCCYIYVLFTYLVSRLYYFRLHL